MFLPRTGFLLHDQACVYLSDAIYECMLPVGQMDGVLHYAQRQEGSIYWHMHMIWS